MSYTRTELIDAGGTDPLSDLAEEQRILEMIATAKLRHLPPETPLTEAESDALLARMIARDLELKR